MFRELGGPHLRPEGPPGWRVRVYGRRAARIASPVIALAALAALLAQGCPSPRLPAVEGCRVGASACRNDTPHVCSSTGRFHAVGDLACSAVGGVCVEGADGGVAHCAPVADGGVSHD